MKTIILSFLKKNILSLIVIAVGAFIYYGKYVEADQLRQELAATETKVETLKSELSAYVASYNQQVEENKTTFKKLIDLQIAHDDVINTNVILSSELADITASTKTVASQLSSLESKLTDDIMLAKPFLIQKRMRAASKKTYDKLQKETT